MSQTGNYQPDYDLETLHILSIIVKDLNLNKSTNPFDEHNELLYNIKTYVGDYKNYNLAIRYETINKRYISFQIYRGGYNFSKRFSADIIRDKGAEWCIGYMAYELEKNI